MPRHNSKDQDVLSRSYDRFVCFLEAFTIFLDVMPLSKVQSTNKTVNTYLDVIIFLVIFIFRNLTFCSSFHGVNCEVIGTKVR